MQRDDLSGLISRSAVVQTQCSDQDLRRLVKKEELDRVWRGKYLPVPAAEEGGNPHADALERYRQKAIAAAKTGTGSRVVSHSSAASMLRVPLLRPDTEKVHFTAVRNGRIRGQAIIHQSPLEAHDVVEIDGVLVTSLARTLADTARMGDFYQALTVLDQGLRRGAQRDEVRAIMESQSRTHGIGMLRRALPLTDARSESVGESLSRAVMLAFDDIPAPEIQVQLAINGGLDTAWSDFCWSGKLVGEFDGHIKYMRSRPFSTEAVEDVVYAEKLREDAIRDLGIVVIRWTWNDLRDRAAFRQKIIEGLRRAGLA